MNAVDEIFWRDEILQALFWMRGEGLAEAVTPSDLARFLAADEALIGAVLSGLVEDGYVEGVGERATGLNRRSPTPDSRLPTPARYRLTPPGVREGGRRFRDEFAGLTQQAHGECGPGCWCRDPEHEGEPCPSRQPERARA